ncbi:MAG TPA: VCBS repeat-containing protein, partial [Bacteroidia bacterium]|nr:VCBS repeat-containing protein [Bacteroidia bacterium]
MKKITLLALFLLSILEIKAQTGPCFSSPVLYYGFSQASRGIASGDLNNDGIPDLATANPTSTNIGWAFMSANGSILQGGTILASSGTPRAVTIADLNGDTIGDIIVAATNSIIVCIGSGTGGFTTSTLNVGNPFGIASG